MTERDEFAEQLPFGPLASYPNASRRQQIQVITRQDQPQKITKSFNCINWNCTTLLTLSVACIHISASTYIASHSHDKITIFFAIAAITVNLLLCYGAIFSRRETLITWLAFYGILSFVAMSIFTPKNMKVFYICLLYKNV